MTIMTACEIDIEAEDNGNIVLVHPASPESVELVLSQNENSPDGRSNFVWVRLPNGNLVLGVFPQGDTYFQVENDAAYPD